MKATLDGEPVPYWAAVAVKPGSVLKLKAIEGAGYRTYLAVQHGFDVPDYLGSKSTFDLGKFGGHAGRTLRPGDVLKLNQSTELPEALPSLPSRTDSPLQPPLGNRRALRPPRRTRLLHRRRHRHLLRHRLESPLQLHPHRHSADRPQAQMGPQRRRRSRTPPLQHPRQRLRRRHDRFHRRYARDPGPRRPQPRRFRLPRHDRPRRTLENRPTQTRRHPPLPPPRPRHRPRSRTQPNPPNPHPLAPPPHLPISPPPHLPISPPPHLPHPPPPNKPRSHPRHLPPSRRPLHPGGIRAAGAGYQPPLLCPYLNGMAESESHPRNFGSDPRNSIAANPLRRPASCPAKRCWMP